MNRRRWRRSQTVILPLDARVHGTVEAAHLLNRANGNEFYSVGVTQNPELLACGEMQSLPNCLRNDDLKFGRKSDGIDACAVG